MSVFELSDVKLYGHSILVIVSGLASAMHLIVFPHAFVLVVFSTLYSLSIGFVVLEVTLEVAFHLPQIGTPLEIGLLFVSVIEFTFGSEGDDTFPIFDSFVEEAFVDSAIRVALLTQPFFDTSPPFALIIPLMVCTKVFSITMRLILIPFAPIITTVLV